MFARKVHMHLKPNSIAEFTQRLEKDILPLLRKQKGFQDEITFVAQVAGKRSESVCGTRRECRGLQSRIVPSSDEVSRHGSRGNSSG
jgi:hypothetical protein